jgi:hypothetical protein
LPGVACPVLSFCLAALLGVVLSAAGRAAAASLAAA